MSRCNLRDAVSDPAPHRMTTDCQYTRTKLGQADAGCDGCKHRMIDQATPEKLNG